MKRRFCLLCVGLLLFALPLPGGCAKAEPVQISVGVPEQLISDLDANNDWYLQMLRERYNVTFNFYNSYNDFDNLTDLWIQSGDMPDVMSCGIEINQYMEYAKQGLLGAFPDGWETAYPNLYREYRATQMQNLCELNGKTYVYPRIIIATAMGLPFNAVSLPWHDSLFIRSDWVKQMSGDLFLSDRWSFDQLYEYLRTAVESNPDDTDAVYGLAGTAFFLTRQFLCAYNPYYDYCYKVDGRYVLGAAQESSVEGIRQMKRFYDAGLFVPGFQFHTLGEAIGLFAVGKAAAVASEGHATGTADLLQAMYQSNDHITDYYAAKPVYLVDDQGVFRYPYSYPFWRTILVSPYLKEDPQKEAAVFTLLEHFATLEGTIEAYDGVRGQNWDFDAAGKPYALTTPTLPRNQRSVACKLLYHICPSSQDGYELISPLQTDLTKAAGAMTLSIYNHKLQYMDPSVPTFVEMSNFFFDTGENRSLYDQIDWQSEILRIVTAGKEIDVAAAWKAVIDKTQNLWQPLLDELNQSGGEPNMP